MLADYLPIIKVHQFQRDRQRRSPLFAALCEAVARKGCRIGVVPRLALHSNGERSDSSILKLISNDLLLVTGHCDMECAQLHLGEHPAVRDNVGQAYPFFVCADLSEAEECADAIFNWLTECMQKTPLWGCILIGGKSSRMGSPKHLLDSGEGGTSWLERSVGVLSSQVANIVLSGGGKIPAALNSLQRIDDVPGRYGPLAGISAVVKAYPFVSWIVMACDMPDITVESIRWIIDQRRVGRLAVLPYNRVTDRIEPLYGWYDFRSAPLLESLAASGEMRVQRIGQCAGVFKPDIPERLTRAWRNVNRPEDLNCAPLTKS